MKTYLINLDRSTDRLAVMNERMSAIGITAERVSGVEGAKLDLKSENIAVPNYKYPRSLTLGEIGCFLSHRKCWEKFVQSGDEWALILEDDCIFHKAASRYLTTIDWIPSGCQLVHFYYAKSATVYSDKTIKLADGNYLYRTKISLPVGAYAYFISREAALKALELSQVIEEPVDNFLFGIFSQFPKVIDVWRPQGAVVLPCEEVQSTIPGRQVKSFSWYQVHPKRLFNKFKIKFLRKRLQSYKQFLMTE